MKKCGHTSPVTNSDELNQEVLIMRDNFNDLENSRNCRNSNNQNNNQNNSRNNGPSSGQNNNRNSNNNSSRNSQR